MRTALLWILSATAAFACPVCGGGDAPNQQAFLDTMVFLSVLPLGMIGAAVAVVVVRYRQIAAKEAEASQQS